MTKSVWVFLAVVTLGLTLFSNFAGVSAQSSTIATGVVVEVEAAGDGALSAFSIISGDGGVVRYTVSSSNPNTQYGLENRVGDRWVSDQATEPEGAAIRLKDQQRRLAQISVQSDADGVATSVVQAESTDVDTNLGYLFAVVAIAWLGIIVYVVYMGVRQRTMTSELARMRGDNENHDA